MSQILERLSRIARSYMNFGNNVAIADAFIFAKPNMEDSKLKRMIDELKKPNENKGSFDFQADQYQFEQENKKRKNVSSEESKNAEFFKSLNLSIDADEKEIKIAYKKMMKQYHPDKFESKNVAYQEISRRKSLEINEAYQKLKKLKGF